jgi:hypothetical protein
MSTPADPHNTLDDTNIFQPKELIAAIGPIGGGIVGEESLERGGQRRVGISFRRGSMRTASGVLRGKMLNQQSNGQSHSTN